MKIQQLFLVLIAATALLVITGCHKSQSPGAVSVNTDQLTSVFQSAQGDMKTAADSVVTAVKNADYAGALTQLKALGEKYKLTPEQQQAVNDLMAQVQKAIDAAAGKISQDASKAATDIGNAMKK